MLTHVDLFSGIGGFALAASWNGIRTVQFCEIDRRCRDFLSRAWPGVPCHDDIRTLHWDMANTRQEHGNEGGPNDTPKGETRRTCNGAEQLLSSPQRRCEPVYILTAGVPCQPASRAGKQRGAEDDRWLWPEAIRILSEVRPTWALYENPAGIGDVGLSGILAKVEDEGYEVRVFSIPACAVGSPQRRERFWIVCRRVEHPSIKRQSEQGQSRHTSDKTQSRSGKANKSFDATAEHCQDDMADAASVEHERAKPSGDTAREPETAVGNCRSNQWANYVWVPCADGKVRRAPDNTFSLVDGLHRSVLGALGNSIVPQVAARVIAAMKEADNE